MKQFKSHGYINLEKRIIDNKKCISLKTAKELNNLGLLQSIRFL